MMANNIKVIFCLQMSNYLQNVCCHKSYFRKKLFVHIYLTIFSILLQNLRKQKEPNLTYFYDSVFQYPLKITTSLHYIFWLFAKMRFFQKYFDNAFWLKRKAIVSSHTYFRDFKSDDMAVIPRFALFLAVAVVVLQVVIFWVPCMIFMMESKRLCHCEKTVTGAGNKNQNISAIYVDKSNTTKKPDAVSVNVTENEKLTPTTTTTTTTATNSTTSTTTATTTSTTTTYEPSWSKFMTRGISFSSPIWLASL